MANNFTLLYGSMKIKIISVSNKIHKINGFNYYIHNCLNGHTLYIKENYNAPSNLELLGHQIVRNDDIKGKDYYFKL